MTEIPKKLYKYQSFSLNSLMNLKSNTLYFGSPKYFNDPYDCAIIPRLEDPTMEDIEEIRQHELNDETNSSDFRKELSGYDAEELKKRWMFEAMRMITQFQRKYFDKAGVVCFSENNDNLAMWAHYGGKYKGFCLEFDPSLKIFEKIKKVNYEPRMPGINLVKFMIDDEDDQIIDILKCTKSSVWEYEDEWRLFHELAGTKYTYVSDALKAIYFGPEIEIQARDIICLIMSIQNPKVEFYEDSRSDREFKVEFRKFDYVPFTG